MENEAARLKSLGWEVGRYHNRFRISRQIATIEEAAAVLEDDVFHCGNRPAIVTVRFKDVKCASVEGYVSVERGWVIMCNPADPLKTELFPFGLDVRLISTEIDVTVSQEDAPRNGEMFMQLLHICERKFAVPGDVRFNNRRAFKRAKRRYLLWLRRRGKLTPDTEPLWKTVRAHMDANGQQIGKLRGAYQDWRSVLQVEQELRA